jgi:hypothetical protein
MISYEKDRLLRELADNTNNYTENFAYRYTNIGKDFFSNELIVELNY